MSLILKLYVILGLILSLGILWKILHIEQMLRHTQNCLYFGRPDNLMYATKAEAARVVQFNQLKHESR